MEADKWLTLPDDLLVEIFCRLESTAVIRCAAACRPWRRAIIDNACCLWPRPDRSLPDVLVGVLDKHSGILPWLYVRPAVWVDGSLYRDVLASRDGFLLLRDHWGDENHLCLWSSITGFYWIVPAAAFSADECIYVLATTGNDDDDVAVWILAVQWQDQRDAKEGTTYQIFSPKSGEWGPVKRSPKLPADVADDVILNYQDVSDDSVVCRGTVSWMFAVDCSSDDVVIGGRRICEKIFSVELSTGRTWITDGPPETGPGVLAVSEDGQLSLATVSYSPEWMEVWVLVGNGDGEWTRRRTLDVKKLIPNCRIRPPSGFCHRSGYVFGKGLDEEGHWHHFVIGIDGSSPRLIGRVESDSSALTFPCEMDWSAYISLYISKMKYF